MKSHRPPAADGVIVTELAGSAHGSYERSHHGGVEHCEARRPTGAFPQCSWTRFAPPVVGSCQPTFQHHHVNRKKHGQSTRTDSQTCRERDGRRKEEMSLEDPAFCAPYPVSTRESQAQLEVRTQSARNGPTVKELMDRVARYLTSIRCTATWSHRLQSSRATTKHHDTSNTTTIKTLPQRTFVSLPRRSTTSGDTKTANAMPFFSTAGETCKLPLNTSASWR